jgi:hypothetical protein
MQRKQWQRNAVISLLAITFTLIAGWAALRDVSPLFYLGLVGAVPLILITGVHGGGTSVENTIGGTVFVIVNFAFYYVVLAWIARRWLGRGDGEKS